MVQRDVWSSQSLWYRGHFCVGWGSGYVCFCFSRKKTSCYSQVFCICAFDADGQSCSALEGSLCYCTVCGRWCTGCLLCHYPPLDTKTDGENEGSQCRSTSSVAPSLPSFLASSVSFPSLASFLATVLGV